ncbi:MAG: ATP-binding protein [Desulfobulbus sp.]
MGAKESRTGDRRRDRGRHPCRERLEEIGIGNNGSGIPKTIRSRIFEPFFITLPRRWAGGTGRGLALVYDGIVNKHGGKVDFTTKAGRGTAFVLRLPIGIAARNALVPQ